MKTRNFIASILRIASMTVLVGLCVLAQSKEDTSAARTLLAETSSTASKSEAKPGKPKAAPEPSAKAKSASSATSDKEIKPETKSSQAPPLASIPAQQPLPFKLNDRNQLATETPSAGGMLLRTFGMLALIVGFIAAAGWGLRYFGIINFGKQQSEAAGLKVLDTVTLGERRTLTLVKFGERTLLIGSTPQGLTLLAEQSDEVPPEVNYRPTVRTVTDLLDVNAVPEFEQEMARASLINTTWSDRSVQ